ncbi:kinase-like domain-containing protein [Fennellomyces sp. T-0311]|nr:kinase-like domain-containing protein [Fennellomyces sp. T-0311]
MSPHYSVAIEGGPEIFTIDTRYRIVRKVGSGSYGTVCSAYDLHGDRFCAIKKVHRVFDKRMLTKRCLREIKLLQHLNHHPRIIELLDMDVVDVNAFNEIYLVFDCMDASLHDVIHSDKPLSMVHGQWILYQMLSGLKYIHAAHVIHRDLKPANILINIDCDIKICDFGMARGYNYGDKDTFTMTEYVTTRWYRAPEIMISPNNYSKSIDVWSVGCIFAEILGRRVLFKGRDYIDQLHKILGILGLPEDITFWDPSESVAAHLQQLCTVGGQPPPRHPIDFHSLFPDCPEQGIDLLKELLQLDPRNRVIIEDAMAHPFVLPFSDPEEEALQPDHACDFSFEYENGDEAYLRNQILSEILGFRRNVRSYESGHALRRHHSMDIATTRQTQRQMMPSATMSNWRGPRRR